MNIKAVDFVLLTVDDIDRSVSFYQDFLGLALEAIGRDSGWAEFALQPTTLLLWEADELGSVSPGRGGTSVALAVDDVGSTVEEFREEGLAVQMEPHEYGVCEMAIATDPDDNLITIHRRKDGTHGRRDPFP